MAGRTGFLAGACAAMLTCGAWGCSGATETGLFSGGDAPAPPPPSTADAAAHPSSRDAGGGGVTGNDASLPDPPDGAPPETDDANIPDTSSHPDNPGIQCGTSYCHPGTDICCRVDTALSPTFLCLPPQGCSTVGELAIACDDADDCAAAGGAGEVCCVTEDAQTGRANRIACTPASACTSNLQTNMCSTNAPACANGGTCKPSQTTIPGYDICI